MIEAAMSSRTTSSFDLFRNGRRPFVTFLLLASWLVGAAVQAQETELDPTTGLTIAGHWQTVRTNCTVCHSASLITQQHQNRDGWVEIIRWMQETQGLRKFDPKTEHTILTYLVAHYGPQEGGGRRLPLPPDLMPPNPYASE